MNIIDFNLIFPIPFFLVYFTVTGNTHSLIGLNACNANGNVKLHVRGFFLLHLVSMYVKFPKSFFLLHLLSNDIILHTSFQTKLNTIENCTRTFFTLYRV